MSFQCGGGRNTAGGIRAVGEALGGNVELKSYPGHLHKGGGPASGRLLGLSHPSHVLGTWEPLRRDTGACAEHRTPSCPPESPWHHVLPHPPPRTNCSGLGGQSKADPVQP